MKPSEKIQRLKEEGYEVEVVHQRWQVAEPGKFGATPSLMQKGGLTRVTISHEDGDGKTKVTGIAECSPRDNFNKRLGLMIALNRACFQLERMDELVRRQQRKKERDPARA